ncbi:hypothetical protein HMPREF0063_11015 [Aeromicrobium marinum DSM 15272]|uniref:DUF2752 domain-containing protein n=1 Tax=Aeromicrobium marinum DSM 15272 TaxID=585531 RepID=E2S929_9ACTN|nr:DUF2752 domain-containing protein [Aeromicrobium marinum]EFQ84299.1 hypothetical protein HMPREF0063_11015 [Aeromicrobium marinum DSM 15272]
MTTAPTGASVRPAERSRAALLRAPVLLGAGGLLGAAALHVRDPHESGSWGYCPFLLLTGLPCPGCGGMRAVNDLTHGDVVGALGSNAMAVALVAFLAISWLVWTARRARGHDVPLVPVRPRGATVAFVVVLAFGVFRLTPWGVGLQP